MRDFQAQEKVYPKALGWEEVWSAQGTEKWIVCLKQREQVALWPKKRLSPVENVSFYRPC